MNKLEQTIEQVRKDHQGKLSDYAVKRIAEHRIARESNNAIINAAPVMIEGKMPVHATRKQLLGMFKARKVMKADYTNRNNTLSMRLAAKNAYTELCSRMRCELVNGARSRVVPFGWDKV